MPHAEVRERLDHIQFQFKDTSVVNYFRSARPSHLTGTTYEPGGRFRVDKIPVAYHDSIVPAPSKR